MGRSLLNILEEDNVEVGHDKVELALKFHGEKNLLAAYKYLNECGLEPYANGYVLRVTKAKFEESSKTNEPLSAAWKKIEDCLPPSHACKKGGRVSYRFIVPEVA